MDLAALSGSNIRRQCDVRFFPLQHFRQDIVPARQCCRSRSACPGLFQRTTALLNASSVSSPSICMTRTIQLCLCRVMVSTSSTSIVGRVTQRLLPVGDAHATKYRVVADRRSAHCAAHHAMHSLYGLWRPMCLWCHLRRGHHRQRARRQRMSALRLRLYGLWRPMLMQSLWRYLRRWCRRRRARRRRMSALRLRLVRPSHFSRRRPSSSILPRPVPSLPSRLKTTVFRPWPPPV